MAKRICVKSSIFKRACKFYIVNMIENHTHKIDKHKSTNRKFIKQTFPKSNVRTFENNWFNFSYSIYNNNSQYSSKVQISRPHLMAYDKNILFTML